MRHRAVREVNPRDDPENTPATPAQLRDDLLDIYAPKSGAALAAEFAAEEDELNAVLAAVGAAGGGGYVVIRRVNPESQKWEWLAKMNAADFVAQSGPAYIAKRYGGGDYEVIVYGADSRIVKRPKVSIAKDAIVEKPNEQNGIDRLGAFIAEGFKALALQLQQQARPVETKEAWLRELAMMRELFGGGKQDDTLGQLSKLLPIVREMVPRDGETNLLDTMIQLAREFGPSLTEAIKRTPVAAIPAPGPNGNPAVPGKALPPEQIGANQMQLMLKAKLALLCSEAQADSDPGPYAEIIVTKVSPEMLTKLVNDPNWLDELAKIHAGVKLFPKWFSELRDAVIEVMQPPPEEDVPEEAVNIIIPDDGMAEDGETDPI